MKILTLIFIALLGVPHVMGCDDNQLKAMKDAATKENFPELRKKLAECLPVGSSYEEVDRVLKNLGWDYNYYKGHNAFVSTKKLKGWFLMTSSAQLTIDLDDKQQVKEIKLSVANTSWFG
jgi:hypothetical protein